MVIEKKFRLYKGVPSISKKGVFYFDMGPFMQLHGPGIQ